jgi:carbon monoxide dehydrogenase subunit G
MIPFGPRQSKPSPASVLVDRDGFPYVQHQREDRMLRFEGDKEFPYPAADLWARLSDAQFLVQCVPGIDTVKRAEPGTAVWTLRPGLSFVRGTMEVTLTVAETVPDSLIRLLVHSKGIGTSSDVEVVFTLIPQETGTRIHWTTEVKALGGLLKAVPQGLIKASAQKVIADVWTQAEKKLAG